MPPRDVASEPRIIFLEALAKHAWRPRHNVVTHAGLQMTSKTATLDAARYHHGDLRNALIAEGRRALEEIGAHDLSLRHLARAVGVSEAAPSRHFSGKGGLLAAIAADGFRELIVLRERVNQMQTDPMIRSYQMMSEYVAFARGHKGLFDLMVGPRVVSRDAYPELNEEAARSFHLFASSVEDYATSQGWNKRSLPLVVHAAWSTEHGLATLILGDRMPHAEYPMSLDRIVHFSITLFLSSISAGAENVEKLLRQLPKSSNRPPPRTYSVISPVDS